MHGTFTAMPKPKPRAKRPHRLALYEEAVQHPLAEVAFIEKVYAHYGGKSAYPLRLREDFAGSAAVSAAWVFSDPDREAMAVENHGPTIKYAQRVRGNLDGLHLVESDVMDFDRPQVDAVASLNFSTFIWHTRKQLVAYFRQARRCLRPGGVFVMDAFGGPGAQRLETQRREHDGFDYLWEQKAFNPVTARIDCRIHFAWPDGQRLNNAFRYDWRLWGPAELTEALSEAGFAAADVWADDGRGRYRPTAKMPAEENWVVYVVGHRG